MTKSPRKWIDGYKDYQRKRLGDRKFFKGSTLSRIADDYLRLIVKTEIAADRKARMKDKVKR